ncbi:MAG: hypothetical protein R3220_07485 [Balneolaceae bacterium]|nr:hypothetical protein [Balneolaceae bacterium]
MSASNPVNQFSMERFKLVMRRTIVLNQRTWFIGFASIAGFLLVIAILPFVSNMFNVARSGFAAVREPAIFFYMVGGLVLTSMIFNEVHSPTKAFQFLTLPSTTLEKLAAAWFTTTVIYTVITMASIVVLSIVIETIKGINTGVWSPFNIFNPFTAEILTTVLLFFFYQSIYLLGAVYFQKNNFLKTLLVIIVVSLGFIFFLNIGLLIFGLAQNEEFFINIQIGNQPWFVYLKYAVGTGLTLLFIWLSYLQLKNKQVA